MNQRIQLRTLSLLSSITIFSAYTLGFIKLPKKYYFDSITIEEIARGIRSDYGDQSYGAIAFVIRESNLLNYPILSKLLLLFIFLAVAHQCVANQYNEKFPLLTIIVILCILVIGSIYFHMYTKELIPLAINYFLLLFSGKNKNYSKNLILLTALISCYALLARSYWMITIFVLIYFQLISRVKMTRRKKMIVHSSVFAISNLVIFLYNPGNLSSIQHELNYGRTGSEFANTALNSYPEFLPQLLYWPYRTIALFFPILLVYKMNFQSFLFSIFICLSTFLLAKNYKFTAPKDRIFELFANYLCSHLIVLSLFEPDYGSFVKHLTPFFPIVLFLICRKSPSDGSIK